MGDLCSEGKEKVKKGGFRFLTRGVSEKSGAPYFYMKESFILRFSDLSEEGKKKFVEYTGELMPQVMNDEERPVAIYLGKVSDMDEPVIALYRDASTKG